MLTTRVITVDNAAAVSTSRGGTRTAFMRPAFPAREVMPDDVQSWKNAQYTRPTAR